MRRRTTSALLVLGIGLGACGDGAPGAGGGTGVASEATEISGITLTPPDGWAAEGGTTPTGVVAAERWTDPDQVLRSLQVVIGCDPGGIEDLVAGATGSTRGSLVVTAAEERLPRPDVDGLDEARRVSLTLGAGRGDDADTLTTEALYGQAGDALVLVELTVPVTEDAVATADDVLGSVRADGETLTAACTV